MQKSYANPEVLEFYRIMPFNYMASAPSQAAAVKQQNVIKQHYSILEPYLKPGVRILDVGCGTGWLSHTLAYHYKVEVTGIDFNPVAAARAQETAALMQLDATFVTTDLFTYEPAKPFEIVLSLGVLHHTDDCLAGVRLCAEKFLAPGGVLFIGLYHAFGRKPFLSVFEEKKKAGATKQEMLDYYTSLAPNNKAGKTFLESWFRDQVLHPHETQHTLAEIVPLLEGCGLQVKATSINSFAPIMDMATLFEKEKEYFDIGKEKLAKSEYYPGFFIVMAEKKRK